MITKSPLRRRTLLAGAAGLSAGLVGCSAGTQSEPAVTNSPVRGGVLRAAFAGGSAQETLDPHRANLFLEASRSKMIFEKLADYGNDMAAVPRLAESWEPNKGLTEWTVRLRDAVFHDGSPVRSADVLYSYHRITDPEQAFRASANFSMVNLKSSTAVDDRTIRFTLSRPYAEFPNSLAAFGAFIVPEGTDEFSAPIGSGPFRFEAWKPGQSLTLKRFGDYWEGAPFLDQLVYLISNEETARINALISGQVDYAHDVSAATASSYDDRTGWSFTRLPNSGMNGFAMKVDRPPFNNVEARRALFALTDREELVRAALGGAGTIGNDLFGRGYQYNAGDLAQRRLDRQLAAKLIKTSGLDAAPIVIDTSDAGTGMMASTNAFADQLRAAGLQAQVRQREPGTYWSEILNDGTICAYRSGGMPIESHISQRLLSDSSTNATRWQDPEFDRKYAAAISTADAGRRGDLYHDLQQTLHDDGGFLIWGFADWIVATSNSVGGIVQAPANSLDWARFDRVWVA